jgi:RNA polymerase sigma-70 factor (ECF subfamily)
MQGPKDRDGGNSFASNSVVSPASFNALISGKLGHVLSYTVAGARTMSDDVTRLLQEWRNGSQEALDRLIPLVYAELRTLAARYLSRERQDHTLQTTALVHEAYVKLVDQHSVDWQNRAHFFGIAANLMRRILVDDARHRSRHKRGAGAKPELLDDLPVAAPEAALDAVDTIALDRALQELETLKSRAGASRRAAILWRADARGDCRSPGGLTVNGQTRMGHRQGLALSRTHGRTLIDC